MSNGWPIERPHALSASIQGWRQFRCKPPFAVPKTFAHLLSRSPTQAYSTGSLNSLMEKRSFLGVGQWPRRGVGRDDLESGLLRLSDTFRLHATDARAVSIHSSGIGGYHHFSNMSRSHRSNRFRKHCLRRHKWSDWIWCAQRPRFGCCGGKVARRGPEG